MSFGFKHFNKLRCKHHIFDFLPEFILNNFEYGVKPQFKNFTVFKADMNLLSFFGNDLVDGFKNKTMVFGGFGFTDKVKPQIISIKFLISFNVKVHFVKVNF